MPAAEVALSEVTFEADIRGDDKCDTNDPERTWRNRWPQYSLTARLRHDEVEIAGRRRRHRGKEDETRTGTQVMNDGACNNLAERSADHR